ncbi:trafficking protein particle complex [Seminavis robusta]|uniref:Trafficking protein particle complex n=1 Tax=Seminavis robusta TaxID=568900 RepID=A0A9N8ESZ6_9STRA|nr:trafficking protein particle complex [Seminavis robusta]|eukprot:Sro1857_g302040.1 trafficking protein particle complex (1542) ;mRNA; f:6330-11228
MESYPEDLLVGVFPLVFAVNAIVEPAAADDSNAESPPSRTDFDRFLDAVAGSLADEDDAEDSNVQLEFQPIVPIETPTSSRNVSMFRPDDYDLGDSTDDDLLMDDTDVSTGLPGAANSIKRRTSSGANSLRLYAGFGLTRRSLASGGTHSTSNTSYAKALQQGQGFFQRARIQAIQPDHAFPTSKDPEGTQNITSALRQAKTSAKKAKEIFTDRPILGILPARWLQKHVSSLPSVVMVVVKFSLNNQGVQDTRLLNTVKSLHRHLAPKRSCKIHIVVLVDDKIMASQAQQWGVDISRQIETIMTLNSQQQDSHQVTLLRAGKDLSGTDGFPTSVALKRLHRSVRDSSLTYYQDYTRRTKDKLATLSDGAKRRMTGGKQHRPQPPKELLPLAIRYCFKIAMYYEFQLKFEQSLRYMSEAYKHARVYYHHLIRLSTRGSDLSDEEDDRIFMEDARPISATSMSIGEAEEMGTGGTEVQIDNTSQWSAGIPPPPNDMAHQTIVVADWLNFKLLQAGFGSHTEAGLLAADGQWRQHTRWFCARRFLGGHPIMAEEWYFYAYIARQRLVTSQLVERHPPKALGDLGNEYDEVLLRCAPWRAYEAAAEALLKVGVYVRKALAKQGSSGAAVQVKNDSASPFVGGLDNAGLGPLLEAHKKENHKAKALELTIRAISLFEHELNKEKPKDADDQSHYPTWSRFGARLQYLAGGILVSTQKYGEAKFHLEQAATFAKGWTSLESSIRRLLAECYVNATPSEPIKSEAGPKMSSLVLEACLYSKMSPAVAMRSLQQCSAAAGAASIQWSCQTLNEFDGSLPFSFSVTFPGRTHATTGDTVQASVWLKSNLDYAVAMKSIGFLRMAGQPQIAVPLKDFVSGSKSYTVIPAKETLTFSTKIKLPKKLEEISLDDEPDSKQGKSSSSKSARPRTAGITSAAGSRLISEERNRKKPRNSNAQWSLDFLGGKAVRCDAITFNFCPLESEKDASRLVVTAKSIELTIEKIKRKHPAHLKRTPFEEDNYVASAWCRPLHMPLPNGPRCLRALAPMPDMQISNLTQSVSKGKAVEGTVNRICLKLEAGGDERCGNIKYKIKCTSSFEASDGTTKRLTESDSSEENTVSMKAPDVRAPVLVVDSSSTATSPAGDYGFDLPGGWKLSSSGQETEGEVTKPASLAPRESTYICFQLYRAAEKAAGTSGTGDQADFTLCRTDFEVIVTYKQEKSRTETTQQSGDTGTVVTTRVSEDVSQKFTGAMVWTKSIVATYDFPAKSAIPCGGRHPSNLADIARPVDSHVLSNVPLVDGQRVCVRSILKANTSVDEFAFEIVSIRSENEESKESCLAVTASESDNPESLYRTQAGDPTRWLKKQSKFCLVYSVKTDLTDNHQSATSSLGAVALDWLPIKIELPDEAKSALSIDHHGPLVLKSPPAAKFRGPMSYVEKTPFKVSFHCVPCIPRASVPFEVNYRVTNDTNFHQRLSVALDSPKGKPQVLTCGIVSGDLRLAPHETKVVSYTAIATKPGQCALPSAYFASTRYNSWVVNEGLENQRHLCVVP